MKKLGIACVLAMVGFAGAASAVELDTSTFLHRSTVTFSGYAGAETLTNFPALVRIPANSEIYADSPDGRHICFADAAGNLAPHEIDVWNPDGESFVWVRVPELAGSTTTLTLYSGGLMPSLQNESGEVWTAAGYRAVWHFSGSNAESTTNKFTGTNSSPAPGFTAAGPVGTAFIGDNKKYFMTSDAIWEGFEGTNFAYSAWVKANAGGYGRVLSCKPIYSAAKGFEMSMQGATNKVMVGGPGGTQNIVETTNLTRDYVHLTAVYRDGGVRLYVNGTLLEASVKATGYTVIKPDMGLGVGGNSSNAVHSQCWNGTLDEVRLRWTASSADWVAADYATQHNPNFAVLGAFEDLEPATTLDVKNFRRRLAVTFSGYAGAETLANFPALVRIPAGSPLYHDCAADGSDIRFADAEDRLVPHEVDVWNPNGESLVWVRVPRLAGTVTSLYLYYRHRGQTSTAVSAGDVWKSAGYRGVWHFSGSNKDSSANALAVANSSTAPTFTDAGVVGTAFYSGGSAYVEVAKDDKWADLLGRNVSLSAWVKTTLSGSGFYSRIFSCKKDHTDIPGFELTLQNGTTNYNVIGCGNVQNVVRGQADCNAAFVYVTAVMENGNAQLYVNGQTAGDVKVGGYALTNSVNPLRLGRMVSGGNAWRGWLDEMRLQWAAQSVDWVAADYATQYDPEFAVLGTPEAINAFGTMILFR